MAQTAVSKPWPGSEELPKLPSSFNCTFVFVFYRSRFLKPHSSTVILVLSEPIIQAVLSMKEGVAVDVEYAGPPFGTDKHVEQVEVDEVIAPETSQSTQTGLAEV